MLWGGAIPDIDQTGPAGGGRIPVPHPDPGIVRDAIPETSREPLGWRMPRRDACMASGRHGN